MARGKEQQAGITGKKICTKCGEEKDLEEFPKQKGRLEGRRPDCKKCHGEYRGSHYAENKNQYRAYSRTHRTRHLDKVRGRNRSGRANWRKENRELHRQEARRRRLNKNSQALEFADVLRGDPCSYCGARHQHVDHIDPISKGGASIWENLTSACQRCNNQKIAKPLLIFLLDK